MGMLQSFQKNFFLTPSNRAIETDCKAVEPILQSAWPMPNQLCCLAGRFYGSFSGISKRIFLGHSSCKGLIFGIWNLFYPSSALRSLSCSSFCGIIYTWTITVSLSLVSKKCNWFQPIFKGYLIDCFLHKVCVHNLSAFIVHWHYSPHKEENCFTKLIVGVTLIMRFHDKTFKTKF